MEGGQGQSGWNQGRSETVTRATPRKHNPPHPGTVSHHTQEITQTAGLRISRERNMSAREDKKLNSRFFVFSYSTGKSTLEKKKQNRSSEHKLRSSETKTGYPSEKISTRLKKNRVPVQAPSSTLRGCAPAQSRRARGTPPCYPLFQRAASWPSYFWSLPPSPWLCSSGVPGSLQCTPCMLCKGSLIFHS